MAEGGRTQRQLKNYLLDPAFQLKYTGLLVGVALAVTLGMGGVVWHFAKESTEQARSALLETQTTNDLVRMNDLRAAGDNQELVRAVEERLQQFRRRNEQEMARVEQSRSRVLYALVGSSLLLVLLLGGVGVVVTHKVVGPVYKLKRLLKKVGSGRLDIQERLRKGDELEELFTVFLEMVESLKSAQRTELAQLDAVLVELEGQGASGSALEKLRALRVHMNEALGKPADSVRPPAHS